VTSMPEIKIALQGTGNIGRELLRRVIPKRNYSVVAVGDTSGVLASNSGFTEKQLLEIIELKENRGKLAGLDGSHLFYENMMEMLWMHESNVLVDACNAQTYDLFDEVLSYTNVVTANKTPLADVSYVKYRSLLDKAEKEDKILDFGPTAGAGLRIPNLIEELGCDGVDSLTGCLSGTMNYVSQRINEGRPISTAIKEAMSPPRNYAEPDPRIDLGGEDFARKLVIVGRMCGVKMERSMIQVQDIVPPELSKLPAEEFIPRIEEMNKEIREMISKSNKNGNISWFLGSADIINGEYTIGFEELPMGDPIGKCRESDNVLKLFPSKWRRPVTLMGPGAGPPETVTGLLAGIKRVEKSLG